MLPARSPNWHALGPAWKFEQLLPHHCHWQVGTLVALMPLIGVVSKPAWAVLSDVRLTAVARPPYSNALGHALPPHGRGPGCSPVVTASPVR